MQSRMSTVHAIAAHLMTSAMYARVFEGGTTMIRTFRAFVLLGTAAAAVLAFHPSGSAPVLRSQQEPLAGAKAYTSPIADYGALPDFVGGAGWINGASLRLTGDPQPLRASALRGKVVVVNIWTFACYNCLNALPHIQALEAKYRGKDVVVIGVHTPELAHERLRGNVESAMRRLGVTYPNVLDPDYRIWRSFHNQYWPSVYIADKNGRIRFQHFGEGAYDEEDHVVAQLLSSSPPQSP